MSRQAQGGTILVGDTTPYASELMAGMLRAVGFKRLTIVAGPAAFLEAVKATRFDLALLGDQLGDADGVQLARAIRQAERGTGRHTPIVMLFSASSQRAVVAARDAGVSDFIRKPVSAAVLAARINRLLANPPVLVEEDSYVGPDRRRREAAREGPDRRRSS